MQKELFGSKRFRMSYSKHLKKISKLQGLLKNITSFENI